MPPLAKLPFFEDDEPIFPAKMLDSQKLSVFAQGTTKKSRREKEKEALEAKSKEEQDLMAKAYDEFLDTFEGEGTSSRSSKSGPGFVKPSANESEGGQAYAPVVRGRGALRSRAFEEEDRRSESPPLVPKAKGKRAMDAFLEEIKRDQADREQRLNRSSRVQGRSVTALAAYESQHGSRDRGDPETSNVFVANLPTNVTEASLGNFFAKHGPVGSVKIMWPRGDATQGPGADITQTRRSKSSGLSGFVSFMKRRDAETAVRLLDGFEWGGNILRVGWSKAVPVGPRAQYGQNRDRSSSREREKSHRDDSRSPERPRRSRSRSRSWHRGTKDRRFSRSRSRSRRRSRSRSRHRRRATREPSSEPDSSAEQFVRTVATQVKEHGDDFEKNLLEREVNNPKYTFLRQDRSRMHRLYKSLITSDDKIEATFWDDGYNSVYSTDSAEESEQEHGRKTRLGRLARKRFEAMLRALTGRRGELARCMSFSLEHAEAANEVSDIIIASMLVDSTPVPRKVARLHLVCDILHNSAATVPNAWKYRQEFQSRLGLVFDHLSTIYHSFPGRITADIFKKQITTVVDVWEDWIVFPPDYTSELRARLEGDVPEAPTEVVPETTKDDDESALRPSRFKASTFKPADEGDVGSVDMEMEGEDAIDGEPMEDLDGEPLDDLDGEPLEDVDGAPMVEDDASLMISESEASNPNAKHVTVR
ncbi:hypothetical protein SISNIDRAFT_448686 [Sistotremastrum niveocremeum HHB9708]|uniref:RNA-binding domain-containing protein n=1 Tax=Sistotremastrum niveocremeum HHB9708 TaxID=1314777 RepID=A0A165A3U2_9AGAM|nr:hypothetical protein SISNIDRAFT_448686 [Sistotremastrum niveocremeum HHB9708]